MISKCRLFLLIIMTLVICQLVHGLSRVKNYFLFDSTVKRSKKTKIQLL